MTVQMEDLIDLPSLINMPHALLADGRQTCFAKFLPKETLGAYVKRNGIKVHQGALAVHHNGYRVPDALWQRLIPKPGDQVHIRARMEGGGGGNKVLRTVALVAIAVASAGVGSAVATSAWATSLGATGAVVAGAAASAAVMIGGSILVGALIPEPKK